MIKKTIQIASIVILSILIGASVILFYPFQVSKSNIEIEVKDPDYDCDYCGQSYKIVDILNETKNGERYGAWEIFIDFRGKTLKEQYPKEIENCIRAYNFVLKGVFKKRLIWDFVKIFGENDALHYRRFDFEADSAKAVLREKCENKMSPKEIAF